MSGVKHIARPMLAWLLLVASIIVIPILSACAPHVRPVSQIRTPPAPASKTSFTAPFTTAVIAEINRARANPPKYARLYIAPRLATSSGSYARSLKSCLKEMNRTPPLAALVPDANLRRMAENHCASQGPGGKTGHRSENGDLEDRARVFLPRFRLAGESIDYGSDDTREVVIRLLIDHGVWGKGHRHDILRPEYDKIGAAHGPHARYGWMTVITFQAD